MSSVFLYVAIVAIWAFVLVPRWLRHHHVQPEHEADDLYGTDVPDEADFDETDRVPVHDATYSQTDRFSAPAAEIVETGLRPYSEVARPGGVARSHQPAQPSSRMMLARRRLLTVLVVLTAGAGACAAMKVAPLWACVPPAGVLCVYVLLLREASRADAEQLHLRGAAVAREARLRAAARQAAHEAARTAAAVQAPEAEPSAEIIDISARRGDQLYDQYADATVRAVGD